MHEFPITTMIEILGLFLFLNQEPNVISIVSPTFEILQISRKNILF